jgi:hypothetical protein
MSIEIRLSGEKEEWLVRAAISPASPFIPTDAVETLVAAGFGERNSSGRLEVNAAGRAYIAENNLSTKIGMRRRRGARTITAQLARLQTDLTTR